MKLHYFATSLILI